MAALVAKSYQDLEQVSDVFTEGKKQYVKVRMKNGSTKTVRAYSEKEYAKFYPEVKIIQKAKSRRDVLGFGEAGYIWIFKGNTYDNLEWFRTQPTRYSTMWGWYLPSDLEMPVPLPADVEPIKLMWNQVADEDDQLYSDKQIKSVVDTLIYEKGESEYVGEVGDKLNIYLTCTHVHHFESIYGLNTLHTFTDANNNIFVWSTMAKTLEVGKTYHITATVKDHQTYHNQCQTILKNCRIKED